MSNRVRTAAAPDAVARSGEIEVERIDSTEKLERLRPDWDRIQDSCRWKHVLLDHRWVSAWWRKFGADKELHVLALRQDGRIVGIAPMVLSAGWEAFPARDSGFQVADDYAHLHVPRWLRILPIRRVTFPLNIPSHNPSAHFLLQDDRPELYRAIARYWADRAEAWDLMSLDGFPVELPQSGLLTRAANEASLGVLPHGIVRTFFSAELGGSFDAYLKSRSYHFRKRLKEQLRSCEKCGDIDVREYRRSEISEGLAIMFAIEQRTWKARLDSKRRVQLHLDERIRSFLSDAALGFAADDRSQVLVMTLNGRPVGALLGLARQDTNLSLVVYLDDAYRGRLNTAPLWKAFCESSATRGMARVDIHGVTPFAQKWANAAMDRRRLYLTNDRLYSKCLGAVKAGTTWLSRSIRNQLETAE